jgi:hypothetical protein
MPVTTNVADVEPVAHYSCQMAKIPLNKFVEDSQPMQCATAKKTTIQQGTIVGAKSHLDKQLAKAMSCISYHTTLGHSLEHGHVPQIISY